jgi:SusD family.
MTTYCYLLDAQSVDNTTTSMASENLFGLDITDLTSKTTNYIKPGYLDTDYAAMFLGPDDALSLYENSSSDVRFSKLLSQSTNSYTKGYVPLKVYQGQLLNWFFKNKISMIRLPEIYYIAAECYATGSTPNLDKAMEMLNTIRQRRGIYNDLTGLSADEITEEIKKEYRKEFISEGVMFYYYKRTGTTIIPNYSEPMSDAQYVLPYPEFELQSGRVQ